MHDVDFSNTRSIERILHIQIHNTVVSSVNTIKNDISTISKNLPINSIVISYILHHSIVNSTIKMMLSFLLHLTHDFFTTIL